MEITDGKGRKFNNLADAFESDIKGMIDSTLTAAERAIRGQVCPVHHRRPSVKRHRAGSKHELRFEACCDEARDRAQAAASRVLR
ncbi:MAG: hypothetical protein ACRDJ3_09665 [Solirubrobacteraceae bacterium]